MTERRQCKGCGAEIAFVKDDRGKVHPLDTKAPTFQINFNLAGEAVAIRSDALVSHFSTCPKANDFSRSTRK